MGDVIQLRPIPAMASDETIDGLWKLLQESAPMHVPELFFSTKKRHDMRTRCRKCMCSFPPDTVCPNCGSNELEPFVGVAPITRSTYDAESTLNAIDPEWKERFQGDSGAALDYYMKLL